MDQEEWNERHKHREPWFSPFTTRGPGWQHVFRVGEIAVLHAAVAAAVTPYEACLGVTIASFVVLTSMQILTIGGHHEDPRPER